MDKFGQFSSFTEKMKQKLENVKKKMDEGEEEPAQSAQPVIPKKTLKFSINCMDQFSHEELQSVILRYDSEHKKNKALILSKDDEMEDLLDQMSQLQNQSTRGAAI
jgi:alanyl-tRNA synthetase